MATGTVNWFDSGKGYGFISDDEGSGDLYVHSSEIRDGKRSLEENQRVEFEVSQGTKGPVATDVRSK